MKPERYAEIRDLFVAVREMPADERTALLASINDTALVDEVTSLLESEQRCAGFLEPAAEASPDSRTDAILGVANDTFGQTKRKVTPMQAGRFAVGDLIGTGGFGSVHRGRQTEPITRDVAIKLIKPGMDSATVLARFEAERQVLAMMDHPFIAKVFDAGTTDSGSPYFAMELVDGPPIDEYCDSRQLGLRQRLRLFVDVCRAVHHAHQRGIIHRDIKPSNVLVCHSDGEPIPKVIDFGIAKAVQSSLRISSDSDDQQMTLQGQLLGTLEYMSPEQVEMISHRVETRSDVYSLGALLYKLLTGVAPISRDRLLANGIWQIHDQLMKVTLTPPSRCKSLAKGMGTGPPQDLDWIVTKALEKEPQRRYESVHDLQSDIHRHLNQLPVIARPPSAAYRSRLFLRRHRIAAIAATVTLLASMVGLAGLVTGFRAATQARDRAISEQRRADRAAAELRRAMYTDWVQTGWDAAIHRQHMKAAEHLERCSRQQRGWEWAIADAFRRSQPFMRLEPSDFAWRRFDLNADDSAIVGVSSESQAVWVDLDGKGPAEVLASDAVVMSAIHLADQSVAIGTADGRLLRWDRNTETPTLEKSLDAGGIYAIASSRDGSSLAVTTGGEFVIQLAVEDFAELGRWQLPARSTAVTFTRNGDSILVGDLAGRLIKIQPETDQVDVHPISRHGIRDIILDDDPASNGDVLWVIAGNQFLTFNVQTEGVRKLCEHESPFSSFARASEDCWLLGYLDGTVSAYCSNTNQEQILTQFDAAVHDLRWNAAEDRAIVSLANASLIALPRVDSPVGWQTDVAAGIAAIEILPESRQIAVADGNAVLSLLRPTNGLQEAEIDTLHGALWSMSVAPDESFIATVGDDQRLRVWNLPDLSLRFERAIAWGARAVAAGGSRDDMWIVAAPDPSQSSTSLAEGTLGIFDPVDGTMIGILEGHENWVMTLCVDPESLRLVSGCENHTLRLWDVSQRTELAEFESRGQDVAVSLAIDSTTQTLYSGHRNGELNVWDLRTASRIQTAHAFGNALTSLCLADDRIGATSVMGDALVIWKYDKHQGLTRVSTFEVDDPTFKQFRTTRDGQIACMVGDRTVQVVPIQLPGTASIP